MSSADRALFDTLWLSSGMAEARVPILPGATMTPRGGLSLDESLASTLGVGPLVVADSGAIARYEGAAPDEPSRPTLPRIELVSDDEPVPGETLVPLPVGQPAGAEAKSELHVLGVLGEGGMGRVLLARQRSLARDVAVKVIKPEAANATGVAALLTEARLTGALEHPNIVPVHALGRDESNNPVLVMKRVEGVPWRDLLFDPKHAAWARIPAAAGADGDLLRAHVEILMDVCNAVDFAHAREVFHRDIKPDNVLIGSFGEVYLADWGIALDKKTLADLPVENESGRGFKSALVGTPGYLAPEMCTGDPARVDARTDVFLLGATLHEVLTGAYRHEGATIYEVLVKALECARYVYAPTVPSELAEITSKATARDPNDRYASAREFRAALAGYLAHRGSAALAQSTQGRLVELRALLAKAVDAIDPLAASRLGSECRFGFAQALREWPQNNAARVGLRETLESLASYELGRDGIEAARVLFEELGEAVTPALRAQLVDAEKRLEERKVRQETLARIERDLDVRVSAKARARVFVALSFFSALIGAGAILSTRAGTRPQAMSWTGMFALSGFSFAFGIVAVVVGRKKLFATRVNRHIVSLLMLTVTLLNAHRLIAWHLGDTVEKTLVVDMMVLTSGAMMGVFLITPTIWWSAAWGALWTALLTVHAIDANVGFSVGTLGLVVLLALQWMRLTDAPSELEQRG